MWQTPGVVGWGRRRKVFWEGVDDVSARELFASVVWRWQRVRNSEGMSASDHGRIMNLDVATCKGAEGSATVDTRSG